MVHPLAVAFWANNMDTGNRVQNRLVVVEFFVSDVYISMLIT